jgi:predicted acylesterase/phospholipase RssA/CRP-like cAMP-binding protein
MPDLSILATCPLLGGLGPADLELVAELGRQRSFDPGDHLCRAGEPSDRCWVILSGLVDVLAGDADALTGEVLARHRKGSAIGEVGVIIEEPYAETVVASIPTTALELRADDLAELVQRFPQIVVNVMRTLHGSLARVRARAVERSLGETVALAIGPSLRRGLGPLIETVQHTGPRSVTALDRHYSFAGAVTAADDLASRHGAVLLPVELDAGTVSTLLRESDRVVALAGTASDVAELSAVHRASGVRADVEVVLVGDEAVRASGTWPSEAPLRVIRICSPQPGLLLATNDMGWLARHLTRTKLGLAMGAGGAKGYAHVGVLQVLEQAGYVIDYVAGTSIGGIVGAFLALGANAEEIDRKLRRTFNPEVVAEVFKTGFGGRATGVELTAELLRETTDEKAFADTVIPLTVMTVNLSKRTPAPLREGPLWQALMATTALAGVFPPYELEGERLIDGLALVPVPTSAVIEDGADVTIAVNVISAETLTRWPGAEPPEPPPERRRRGVLDDLLEVMDLSQLSDSVQSAELADVVITPRFGPNEWRDFHLADLFLAAGRAAAEQQLPALRSLASPASSKTHEQGGGVEREDAVHL